MESHKEAGKKDSPTPEQKATAAAPTEMKKEASQTQATEVKTSSLPSRNMEFDSYWYDQSIKKNVLGLLQSYPPYPFNFFSGKHADNISKFNATIADVEKIDDKLGTHDSAKAVYDILKKLQADFKPANPDGEANRKLLYMIKRIEFEFPIFVEPDHSKTFKS